MRKEEREKFDNFEKKLEAIHTCLRDGAGKIGENRGSIRVLMWGGGISLMLIISAFGYIITQLP